MKAKHLFGIAALLLVTIILLLVPVNFAPSPALANDASAAVSTLAQTETPVQFADDSEIGSTDGILVMGVVIVLIVSLPLIFHKKR